MLFIISNVSKESTSTYCGRYISSNQSIISVFLVSCYFEKEAYLSLI